MDASAYICGSFVAHIGALTAMAVSLPVMEMSEDPVVDEQSYSVTQQFFVVAADPEFAPEPPGGSDSTCKCDEGLMGDPHTELAGSRYGVSGPADNPDPHLAYTRGGGNLWFGMGLGGISAGASDPAPVAPWGRDDSLGTDPTSETGNMWGEEIAKAAGTGGLGLDELGEGGKQGSGWGPADSTYGYRCRMP